MKKRTTLILVSAILAVMVCGCGSGKNGSGYSVSETGKVSVESEMTSDVQKAEVLEVETPAPPGEPTVPSAMEDTEPPIVIEYPLSDETVNLTYFCYKPDGPPIVENSWADLQIFQDAEQLTNVHIEFQENTRDSFGEKFVLMCASGDYTDLLQSVAEHYSGGIGKAYTDEAIIDISDLSEENMPNYCTLAHTEDNYPNVLSDEGLELAVCEIADVLDIQAGLFVRSDWMQEQGLQTPETIEELSDLLAVMKNAYGCKNTIKVGKAAAGGLSCALPAAFGISGMDLTGNSSTEHFFLMEDGTVTSTLIAPEFRDYVELLRDWYAAGYYSYESLMETQGFGGETDLTDGTSAVTHDTVTSMSTYYSYGNENFGMTAIGPLAQEKGEAGENHFYNAWLVNTGTAVSISTKCDEPEIALRWLDYWYSNLGYMATNYGPEGVSWEYDENGEPQYTALITEDPEWGATTLIMKYNCKNRLFGYALQDANIAYYSNAQVEALQIFRTNTDNSRRVPTIYMSLPETETAEYTSLYSDISTYASAEVLKFILGDNSMETWDEFQETLDKMGIDRCIEIYQSAYARYLGR